MSFAQSAGLIKAKFQNLCKCDVQATGTTDDPPDHNQTLYKCSCHSQLFQHLTSLATHLNPEPHDEVKVIQPYGVDNANVVVKEEPLDPDESENLQTPFSLETPMKESNFPYETRIKEEKIESDDEYQVAVDGILAEVSMTEPEDESQDYFEPNLEFLNAVKLMKKRPFEVEVKTEPEEGIVLVDCTHKLPPCTVLKEISISEAAELQKKRRIVQIECSSLVRFLLRVAMCQFPASQNLFLGKMGAQVPNTPSHQNIF